MADFAGYAHPIFGEPGLPLPDYLLVALVHGPHLGSREKLITRMADDLFRDKPVDRHPGLT